MKPKTIRRSSLLIVGTGILLSSVACQPDDSRSTPPATTPDDPNAAPTTPGGSSGATTPSTPEGGSTGSSATP